MRRTIIILGLILGFGALAVPPVEAQTVRSSTVRKHHGSYHRPVAPRTGVHYRNSVGWHWHGSVWVGPRYRTWVRPSPCYGYWGVPRVHVPSPRFVTYYPRYSVVPAVPVEQVVPVASVVRDDEIVIRWKNAEVMRLRPGQAAITPDGTILENRDGELVVHSGEQQEKR